MNNRKYSWALAACIMSATPFITTPVSADVGLGGSSDIVCSVMDVVACVENSNCIQGTARGFELPEFIIMDSEKKVIRAAYESGHKAISHVKNLELSGQHLVLQGVENSRGWNISIDTKTGNMSGAVVGEAVSFLVFGACTTL